MKVRLDEIEFKVRPFYLDEETYNKRLESTILLGNEEVKVLDVLNLIHSVGRNQTRIMLGATYTVYRIFLEENYHLLQDFKHHKEVETIKFALSIFSDTSNLKKVCSACNLSKHTFTTLLLTHVSLTDTIKILGKKDVASALSKETISHGLKDISERYNEPEKRILALLSESAIRRLQERAELEKQLALIVGLKELDFNYLQIARELELNPRYVARMLEKHKSGKLDFEEKFSIRSRVIHMQGRKMSNRIIARNLGVKLDTLDIILRKTYISAIMGG